MHRRTAHIHGQTTNKAFKLQQVAEPADCRRTARQNSDILDCVPLDLLHGLWDGVHMHHTGWNWSTCGCTYRPVLIKITAGWQCKTAARSFTQQGVQSFTFKALKTDVACALQNCKTKLTQNCKSNNMFASNNKCHTPATPQRAHVFWGPCFIEPAKVPCKIMAPMVKWG